VGTVSIGFFSFTEVTDARAHRSYNEWHQLDHMPEQYPLPGVIYGQRWVSTPACRARRAVDGPLLAPIHYMTLYLMGEPVDQTLVEFRALGEKLHEVGRFHEQRRSHLSGPFDVVGAQAAPRVLVSAPAVPFRPNRGIYVVVEDRQTGAGGRAWADALGAAEGVAGVWTFETSAHAARHRWRPGDRRITVSYLDEDPLAVAAALAPVVERRAAGGPPPLFAGPLETVTPWEWDWFDS